MSLRAPQAAIQGAVSGAELPVLVPAGTLEFAFFRIGLHVGVQTVTGRIGRDLGL